jgi:26S proteasome regulatory subunit N8
MTEETKTDSLATAAIGDIKSLTVHPLVLLSAADHYNRVARGTRKRVVGVLLGTVSRGVIDATNSFAVPFEEDNKNPNVFYLDHNYLENMLHMFRKVNAKERLVGFYSTGPSIRPNDLRIHSMMTRFLPKGNITPPVFCIIDVRSENKSIPTTAYKMTEEMEGKSRGQVKKNFAHVPSVIGASEPEEVGVEHLLRDINDPTISTITSLINAKLGGLSSLSSKLLEMKHYLEQVASGQLKPNQEIIGHMQSILNLLPNLNVHDVVTSLAVKTNDMHMVIYLSSLIRSVIALHDLVNNKIKYNEQMELGLEGDVEKMKDAASKKKKNAAGEEKKEEDVETKKK